jgi:hypothetical protein
MDPVPDGPYYPRVKVRFPGPDERLGAVFDAGRADDPEFAYLVTGNGFEIRRARARRSATGPRRRRRAVSPVGGFDLHPRSSEAS